MKKIIISVSVLLGVLTSFCGCDSEELENLLDCTFVRTGTTDFLFAEVNFDNLTSLSEMNAEDSVTIATALSQETKPVSFTINVKGTNPNNSMASIEQFKWILLLNDTEVAREEVPEIYSLPPLGSNRLSVDVYLDDITPFLEDATAESMFRFFQTITGSAEIDPDFKVDLKIKPSIDGKEFPDYISVREVLEK